LFTSGRKIFSEKTKGVQNTVLECMLGEAQNGFRRGRPVTDCVLITCQLVEKHREFNLETLITFLYYRILAMKLVQINSGKS